MNKQKPSQIAASKFCCALCLVLSNLLAGCETTTQATSAVASSAFTTPLTIYRRPDAVVYGEAYVEPQEKSANLAKIVFFKPIEGSKYGSDPTSLIAIIDDKAADHLYDPGDYTELDILPGEHVVGFVRRIVHWDNNDVRLDDRYVQEEGWGVLNGSKTKTITVNIKPSETVYIPIQFSSEPILVTKEQFEANSSRKKERSYELANDGVDPRFEHYQEPLTENSDSVEIIYFADTSRPLISLIFLIGFFSELDDAKGRRTDGPIQVFLDKKTIATFWRQGNWISVKTVPGKHAIATFQSHMPCCGLPLIWEYPKTISSGTGPSPAIEINTLPGKTYYIRTDRGFGETVELVPKEVFDKEAWRQRDWVRTSRKPAQAEPSKDKAQTSAK